MTGPQRVLVLGCGFIGSRLSAALVDAGIPTTVLARTAPAPSVARMAGGVTLIVGDAGDPFVIERALDGVDHVVYAAGSLFPGALALSPPAVGSELPPLLRVLAALRRRPHVSLSFISSGGAVYGVPDRVPVDETHRTDPINSYGIMKLAAERHVLAYSRHYGFEGRILRVANVYGPGQRLDRGQGVVTSFLHGALKGGTNPLYGDGSVVRDYLHVDDLTAVIVALLRVRDVPPVLNIGSGVGTSLRQVVSVIEDVTGERLSLTRHPSRPVDVPRIVLDISLLRATVRHEPMDLAAGVGLTWHAMRGALQATG